MDGSQIEEAFDILSQNQPLLSEQDNEWSTNGLNSTPSENLVFGNYLDYDAYEEINSCGCCTFSGASTPQEEIY